MTSEPVTAVIVMEIISGLSIRNKWSSTIWYKILMVENFDKLGLGKF